MNLLRIGEKIPQRRASNCCPVIDRVVVNNVMSDHRMSREWNVQPVGGGLGAVFFVGMRDGKKARFEIAPVNGGQEIERCCGKLWVSFRKILNYAQQLLPSNHFTNRLAVANALVGSDHERKIQVESSFLPDAELSLFHIGPDVFTAQPLEGELPVVNDSCPVSGQERNPS